MVPEEDFGDLDRLLEAPLRPQMLDNEQRDRRHPFAAAGRTHVQPARDRPVAHRPDFAHPFLSRRKRPARRFKVDDPAALLAMAEEDVAGRQRQRHVEPQPVRQDQEQDRHRHAIAEPGG